MKLDLPPHLIRQEEIPVMKTLTHRLVQRNLKKREEEEPQDETLRSDIPNEVQETFAALLFTESSKRFRRRSCHCSECGNFTMKELGFKDVSPSKTKKEDAQEASPQGSNTSKNKNHHQRLKFRLSSIPIAKQFCQNLKRTLTIAQEFDGKTNSLMTSPRNMGVGSPNSPDYVQQFSDTLTFEKTAALKTQGLHVRKVSLPDRTAKSKEAKANNPPKILAPKRAKPTPLELHRISPISKKMSMENAVLAGSLTERSHKSRNPILPPLTTKVVKEHLKTDVSASVRHSTQPSAFNLAPPEPKPRKPAHVSKPSFDSAVKLYRQYEELHKFQRKLKY